MYKNIFFFFFCETFCIQLLSPSGITKLRVLQITTGEKNSFKVLLLPRSDLVETCICDIAPTFNTYARERLGKLNKPHTQIPEPLSRIYRPPRRPQRNKQSPPLLSLQPTGPRSSTTKPPVGNKRNLNYQLPTGAMAHETCNGSREPSST